MPKTKGVPVSTANIESCILAHPEISDVYCESQVCLDILPIFSLKINFEQDLVKRNLFPRDSLSIKKGLASQGQTFRNGLPVAFLYGCGLLGV